VLPSRADPFVERQAGALVVAPSQLFDSNRDQLVALAARHKIPAIYQAREFVMNGGLMSYGASYGDTFRVGGLNVSGQTLRTCIASVGITHCVRARRYKRYESSRHAT
jgi:hypothetical protein